MVGEHPRALPSGDHVRNCRANAKIDHVLLAGFTHEGVEELCACLRKVLPRELDHIFFSDNGSTAVEVALKMAVQYWQNVGRPEKKGIVALEHAYHGDTVGAMSVSDDSSFTDPFRSMLFPRAPRPFGVLLSLSGGQNARDLRHRMR